MVFTNSKMESIPESNYHSLTRKIQASYISNIPMPRPVVKKIVNAIIHRLMLSHEQPYKIHPT